MRYSDDFLHEGIIFSLVKIPELKLVNFLKKKFRLFFWTHLRLFESHSEYKVTASVCLSSRPVPSPLVLTSEFHPQHQENKYLDHENIKYHLG